MKTPDWLTRRAFLGGAAVTVSLPWLESLVPQALRSRARAVDGPRRLVFIHMPNGMIRTKITPRQEGQGYTMPSLLSSLTDLRNDFCILTGLSNLPGSGYYDPPGGGPVSDDGPGDHARDVGTFLTAARLKKTAGSDIRNGISVDQVAANHLRELTPGIPSLELGTRSGSYGGDSGYAPVYKANISWSGPTTPVPKETNPQAVFDRLFAGVRPDASQAERERRQRLDKSVLDYCLDDIASLEGALGATDRPKLDEYLSGVRHLEKRVQSFTQASCSPGNRPAAPADFKANVDVMWDLIKLAFQCDRTRVVSMMLDKAEGYDFLSVDGKRISGNHHTISHLENGQSDVKQIEAINQWQISVFGDLLRKLKGVTEADGATLLDNSLILFGGGLDGTGHQAGDASLTPIKSGGVHRHTYLPLFLGGRGGGYVNSGRHIVYRKDEPIADLYIAMLHSVGCMVDSFALEGTRPLAL